MNRLLLLLLAYALGGAIINVAVAWGCARLTNGQPAAQAIDYESSFGLRRRVMFPDHRFAGKTFPVEFLHEAGWPMLALSRQDIFDWPLQSSVVPLPPDEYRLFRPMWPGFAINTTFYAAILGLLFIAPGALRRRIRARRGQCPACGYPVGSSNVCSECGRPVTPRA